MKHSNVARMPVLKNASSYTQGAHSVAGERKVAIRTNSGTITGQHVAELTCKVKAVRGAGFHSKGGGVDIWGDQLRFRKRIDFFSGLVNCKYFGWMMGEGSSKLSKNKIGASRIYLGSGSRQPAGSQAGPR